MTHAATIALDALRCLRHEADLEGPVERGRVTAAVRTLGPEDMVELCRELRLSAAYDTRLNLVERVVRFVNAAVVAAVKR